MILYIKTGCPYCKKVLDFAAANNVTFTELRNRDDVGVREELIKRGGKSQFPYLVDEVNHVEMYESEDIIKYLTNGVSKKTQELSSVQTCPIPIE
jgi:glutaredoxin